MKASEGCINLIKGFESLRLIPYKDSAGKLSIAYGHLIKPGEHFTTITEEDAEDMLHIDLLHAESAVNQGVYVEINQNQFDALVSLVFNIGGGNFLKSELLKFLEDGKIEEAADQFLEWDHINHLVSAGLLRRRKAERVLFLTPIEDA